MYIEFLAIVIRQLSYFIQFYLICSGTIGIQFQSLSSSLMILIVLNADSLFYVHGDKDKLKGGEE